MLTNAMNYYYQNRSGINIETAYITSRDDEKSSLAHVMGHNPDSAWVSQNGKNPITVILLQILRVI